MNLKRIINVVLKSHINNYTSTPPSLDYTENFDTFTRTMLRASKAADRQDINDEIFSVLFEAIQED